MNLSRHVGAKYGVLADLLRRELTAYTPGSYLPAETELAARYGVNRHTLRRAVDDLIAEGRVLRHKGKGTCVLPRPIVYPVNVNSTYSRVLADMGLPSRAALLSRQERMAQPQERRVLDMADGECLLELQTLRYIQHRPATLIRHCFVSTRAAMLNNYHGGSLRTYLKERGMVLTRAQTWIGAQLPTEREALTLLMPRHVPLLIIHTLSVDASQRAFEYSVSLSRADQFQYHITSGELNEHTV